MTDRAQGCLAILIWRVPFFIQYDVKFSEAVRSKMCHKRCSPRFERTRPNYGATHIFQVKEKKENIDEKEGDMWALRVERGFVLLAQDRKLSTAGTDVKVSMCR